MSRITSDVVKFHCDGHGYMESAPCMGHELYVQASLTSDTVSIVIDGKSELVVSDRGYAALVDAIESLDKRWSRA